MAEDRSGHPPAAPLSSPTVRVPPTAVSFERLASQPPAQSFRSPAAGAGRRPSGDRIAALTQLGFLGLSVRAPPPQPRNPPPQSQHITLPPGLAPTLATAPQLPSLAPKSPVRTRWRGNNFHSLPPPPDGGGSGGGGGGSSGPFNYQLSRSTAAGVRLRPRRLPPRYSNTLWELLFPPAAQTGSSAGQAPLPTRGPSHRPSLSQRPNRLPQRPAISSRSLRGTRKGNMKLHLISLRRGHPPPLRGSRN